MIVLLMTLSVTAKIQSNPWGMVQSPKLRWATLLIAVLWVALVVGLAFWMSHRAVEEEVEGIAASAEYEALTAARIVDRLFMEMTSVANMVARQSQVIELANFYSLDPPGFAELTREERAEILTSESKVRGVGDYMTALADDLHYARIYMNNLSQDTIASSHWEEDFNIVGQIYAGRAYLLDALKVGSGQMFGIARLNQMPSYFVASRIEGAASQPLGSVTVRLDAPEMAQYIEGRHISLIVNLQGRVTTSSDATFMLRNVGPLLPEGAHRPSATDEEPGEPLDVIADSGASDQWLIEGRSYLVRHQPLAEEQYQLLTLASLEHLGPMQRQHYWIAGLVVAAGVILIVLCGALAEQRAARRQEERHAANHDLLTGLPNRRVVLSELDRFFALAKRTQQSVLVSFIDMDDFKIINDTYGHEIGDRFLVEVSRRLLSGLRGGDMLGRWGGDEFIAIGLTPRAEDGEKELAADMMRRRLAPLLVDKYSIGGRVFDYSGASFGIVCADPLNSSPQSVLLMADELMYANKQARREQAPASTQSDLTKLVLHTS
ncbi:GGDEF domain-containing protein [Devosia epidermidihirudinis]|nr:diguanylate cyclase [Devosia epidermidihirudinis]